MNTMNRERRGSFSRLIQKYTARRQESRHPDRRAIREAKVGLTQRYCRFSDRDWQLVVDSGLRLDGIQLEPDWKKIKRIVEGGETWAADDNDAVGIETNDRQDRKLREFLFGYDARELEGPGVYGYDGGDGEASLTDVIFHLPLVPKRQWLAMYWGGGTDGELAVEIVDTNNEDYSTGEGFPDFN